MKENPALYEINTYAWLYDISRRTGAHVTLGNIPASEWNRFEELGFDYLWLMGIWKRSSAGIELFRADKGFPPFSEYIESIIPDWTDEDLVGSPFSVAAYEPDPFIGTWSDIDRAREELHKRGIGLILDFVPNHTAPDHPWVSEHPEYYFCGTKDDLSSRPELFTELRTGQGSLPLARGWDPFFRPWPDTIQLNHYHPGTRSALIEEMKKIADHCDGFRCDMAMLVMNNIFNNTWGWLQRDPASDQPEHEFWVQVREAVPETLLLAAAYWDTEWTLLRMGFDYVYDKKLYDRTVTSSASEIYLHLKTDLDYQKRVIHFLENHNEQRAATVFGPGKAESSAVLFATLPGMRLYYDGQVEGKKMKHPVQIRRTAEEPVDPDMQSLYRRLLQITRHEIFHSGSWRLWEVFPMHDGSCGNLIAYTWMDGERIKLVVVNMSNAVAQGRVSLKGIVRKDLRYVLTDELHNLTYDRSGHDMEDPGLTVILDRFKSHIFDFAVAD